MLGQLVGRLGLGVEGVEGVVGVDDCEPASCCDELLALPEPPVEASS